MDTPFFAESQNGHRSRIRWLEGGGPFHYIAPGPLNVGCSLAIALGSAVMIPAPAFGGLVISLIFGALATTTMTLFIIPLIYYHWMDWRRA